MTDEERAIADLLDWLAKIAVEELLGEQLDCTNEPAPPELREKLP
jgi:hypothetical protein